MELRIPYKAKTSRHPVYTRKFIPYKVKVILCSQFTECVYISCKPASYYWPSLQGKILFKTGFLPEYK